jgi:transcription elongation factor Elf1
LNKQKFLVRKCPFCNSKDIKIEKPFDMAFVECKDCFSRGPLSFTLKNAVKFWNEWGRK